MSAQHLKLRGLKRSFFATGVSSPVSLSLSLSLLQGIETRRVDRRLPPSLKVVLLAETLIVHVADTQCVLRSAKHAYTETFAIEQAC